MNNFAAHSSADAILDGARGRPRLGSAVFRDGRAGLALALLAGGMVTATRSAQASFVYNISEVAGDVVVDGTGTINTTILTMRGVPISFAGTVGVIDAVGGTLGYVNGSYQIYGYTAPPWTGFGSGGSFTPTTASGSTFRLQDASEFLLSVDYVSGSPLSNHMVFAGKTIQSLGLTPGSYTYSMDTTVAGATETLTINITGSGGVSGIPEPGALSLLGLGLTILGLGRLRASSTKACQQS